MSDYLHQDHEGPKLDHPDAMIRVASVVHRFRVPRMVATARKISFAKSFQTVGQHQKTRKLMLNADDCRARLEEACAAKKISSERVVSDARRYIPLIQNILVSCKVQPENARLDEKLSFEWQSGIEEDAQGFKSEAIMYDLTMGIVCEGLGRAASATENSVGGQFAQASRDYAAAAGIFDFLYKDHLPKWIAKGSNVDEKNLPAECHTMTSKALKLLFQANGQQMAVATVLIKPGKPNYSLLAKLCLGISEQLEEFVNLLRREAPTAQARMDKDFFTLLAFQISIQNSLSLYFQARTMWDKDDYGMGIALMSEATVALRTREVGATTAGGVPDVSRIPALKTLTTDLVDLRKHMNLILQTWEKDNNSVYFTPVPQHVPAGKKLQEGLRMNKAEEYKLETADPCLLLLPEDGGGGSAGAPPPYPGAPPPYQRSDSDLARELQQRLNAGEE
jgi:BRO1-like domain